MNKEELLDLLRGNMRVKVEVNNDSMSESKLIVSLEFLDEELSSETVDLPFEWRKW